MVEKKRRYPKPKTNLRQPNIRVAVEEAKEKREYGEIYGGEIIEENVTEGISRANNYIRDGKYRPAIKTLKQAYDNSGQLDEDKRTKYGFAIIKRLKRIEDRVGHSNPIYDEAFDLAMDIQGKKHMQKRVLKDLSDYFKGALGIIGIVGGLFFLSSNITGNVISNVSQSSSNWMGGIFLAIGIVCALLYFKKK